MTLRIMLCEANGDGPSSRAQAVSQPAAGFNAPPEVVDLGGPDAKPLLLYLADEPEIGRQFTYGGARWEIVDYQDGWVARLVVTH